MVPPSGIYTVSTTPDPQPWFSPHITHRLRIVSRRKPALCCHSVALPKILGRQNFLPVAPKMSKTWHPANKRHTRSSLCHAAHTQATPTPTKGPAPIIKFGHQAFDRAGVFAQTTQVGQLYFANGLGNLVRWRILVVPCPHTHLGSTETSCEGLVQARLGNVETSRELRHASYSYFQRKFLDSPISIVVFIHYSVMRPVLYFVG